jgi:biopolymer transport protein ExbB/TolQ
MHSFIGIASSGETTLAVVAPGIAEALLATAMGLVAAIPAVLAYNTVVGSIKKISREALTAVSLFSGHLARIRFLTEARHREKGPDAYEPSNELEAEAAHG